MPTPLIVSAAATAARVEPPIRQVPELPSEADEARWVASVSSGDPAAFAEMFRAYAGRLAAYAYTLVDSPELAQEIVQDLFFAIWQRREQWVVRGTLRQYLYGAIRHRAFDVLKSRRAQRRMAQRAKNEEQPPGMAEPAGDPQNRIESAELSARVQEALRALPEQQRAVIRLRWFDRLTHAEIARALGISVKTSENHAHRAIARLRALLATRRP